MNWFRDPELRKYGAFYLLTTLLALAGGWILAEEWGLWFSLLISGLFFLLIHLQTRKRYHAIRDFSREIDRILHGATQVHWEDYAEGELAILQNEVRKLTLELRDQASALQKEKVELADFLADISHQLRTPLTSVNLILSMLSNPALSTEQRFESTRELQRMMQRMDWLIHSLLKMSRLDSNTAYMQNEPVSVLALVRKAADGLAVPMELREQQLILDIPADASFMGDFSWSAEAIGNILKNCMEHTPAGGSVLVQAEMNPLFCEIRIRDTGKGIDPEDLPHLFERFYRGKNASAESIGIGLALCRMILAEQNGTVKAENRPEGGALFTVRFYKDII
ncbi:MAG: HAMP domain-containing histidine kinase [Clostridia bacterium]|nr:HAMP domain-containing histidine kinase [Clostridia bacterium]